MEEHKRIEQRLYDAAAADYLTNGGPREFGAASASPEFREPYTEFERRVAALATPNTIVVDIGAGTGTF